MKISKKILAIATFVMVSALSMAQGRMMMGGPGGGTQSMLLGREDVQKELKLTDDQKSKLEEMRNAMMEDMRSRFQNGGGGGDREAMMKEFQEAAKKADQQALALLDDTQKKRLKELWIQRSGNRIVMNEEIGKELGITDAQKAKLKELNEAQNQANQEIFEKMRNGELDRSELRPLMEKNNKALGEEIGKVLTADQRAKLKAMGGAEFKFDEDTGR